MAATRPDRHLEVGDRRLLFAWIIVTIALLVCVVTALGVQL